MGSPQQPQAYGPGNPHPLSLVEAELVWDGKYDEYGDRRTVDAAASAMPMQRIETIDEPRARAEAQGHLFDSQKAHLDDFRNRLIWGDNKLVLASLLGEFAGRVDLVYIDPPFDVDADFTMNVPLGNERDVISKEQSALEVVAYRDTWGKGTDSYLAMLYERLVLARELLSESGSLFLHVGFQVNHYVRALLEDVFGRNNVVAEIVWSYGTPSGGRAAGNRMVKAHEYIVQVAKQYGKHKYKKLHLPYSEKYIEERFTFVDDAGRRYRTRGRPGGEVERQYLDESQGVPLSTVWSDIKQTYAMHLLKRANEETGFPTQKPEALIQRIIEISSDEGDLVADFFCGSGTTGAVAESLGRRWIMVDLGRFAIHTSRKRLIERQRELHDAGSPYRAFDVLNLGRYERQWWQKERLKGADEEHRRVILEFFKAEPLANPPSPHLHGRRGPGFCHVDAIDSIFTREEAKAVAQAAADANAKQIYCLSWEFEMDLRLECNRFEKELGIEIKLIQIPREVMERNRKEPPPFLEIATLTAEPIFGKTHDAKTVDLKLTSFIPSLSEVPTKELQTLRERAIRSSFDFIDFWAVDFDFTNGGPFHHDWQDYRLRKDRSLKTTSEQRYVYPGPGAYTACVKVVDIFGSDTSITVNVSYD